MKRGLFLVSAMALLFALLVSACSPAAAPSPTVAPPAAPTAAPAAKSTSAPAAPATVAVQPTVAAKPTAAGPAPTQVAVIKPTVVPGATVLKFNAWTTPAGPNPETIKWYLSEITKRTNGKIVFEQYWLGSLIPAGEEVNLVGKGSADLSVLFTPNGADRLPLTSIANLPGINTTPLAFNKAMADLMQTDALKAEYAKVNLELMAVQGGSPRNIIAKKPIKALADLKGMKVRALGDEAAVVGRLGATTLGLKSAEAYEAMERGTIEAAIFSPSGAQVWKLNEVAKYYTLFDFSYDAFIEIMNLDTWKKLSPDVQKVFRDLASEYPQKFYDVYYAKGEKQDVLLDAWPKSNVQIIDPPASEKAAYVEATKTIQDEWIKKQEARSLPAKKVVDDWLALNKKYAQ